MFVSAVGAPSAPQDLSLHRIGIAIAIFAEQTNIFVAHLSECSDIRMSESECGRAFVLFREDAGKGHFWSVCGWDMQEQY